MYIDRLIYFQTKAIYMQVGKMRVDRVQKRTFLERRTINVEEIRPELAPRFASRHRSRDLSQSGDLVESESPLSNLRPSYFRTASPVDTWRRDAIGESPRFFSLDGRDLHAVARRPQITTFPVVSHPHRGSSIGIRRE